MGYHHSQRSWIVDARGKFAFADKLSFINPTHDLSRPTHLPGYQAEVKQLRKRALSFPATYAHNSHHCRSDCILCDRSCTAGISLIARNLSSTQWPFVDNLLLQDIHRLSRISFYALQGIPPRQQDLRVCGWAYPPNQWARKTVGRNTLVLNMNDSEIHHHRTFEGH